MPSICTHDVAERALREHLLVAKAPAYSHPKVLSLQALANLELTTGEPAPCARNRELLRPSLAGEVPRRMGAYWLCSIAGAATAKLLRAGVLPEAEAAVYRMAEELASQCLRGPWRCLPPFPSLPDRSA